MTEDPLQVGTYLAALRKTPIRSDDLDTTIFSQTIDRFGIQILKLPPYPNFLFTLNFLLEFLKQKYSDDTGWQQRLAPLQTELTRIHEVNLEGISATAGGDIYTPVIRESFELGPIFARRLIHREEFMEEEVTRVKLLQEITARLTDQQREQLEELTMRSDNPALNNMRSTLLILLSFNNSTPPTEEG